MIDIETPLDEFISEGEKGSLDVQISEEIMRDKEARRFSIITVRPPRVSDYQGVDSVRLERGDPGEIAKILGRLTELTQAEISGLLYSDFLILTRAVGRLVQRRPRSA